MNMGGRIKNRLDELGWSQARLIERAAAIDPSARLTPSALSNLIKRDSVRSEMDTLIAKALGVPLLWLVYGDEDAGQREARAPSRPAPPAVMEIESALQSLDLLDAKSLSAHLRAALYDWQRQARSQRHTDSREQPPPKERAS